MGIRSIFEQLPPPLGNGWRWPKPQVWGTVGSGLTPRAQKCRMHPGFPALMAVGGADRFLEDLSKDDTRDLLYDRFICLTPPNSSKGSIYGKIISHSSFSMVKGF